jgi:hypothetical protein
MKKLEHDEAKLINTIKTIKDLESTTGKSISILTYDTYRNTDTTYSRQQIKIIYDMNWNEFKINNEFLMPKVNNDFNNLLAETNEAYYWAGFIFADGSISKDYKSFNMRLSDKDFEHTLKFRKFINYTGIQQSNDISVSSPHIKTFCDKFDIVNNKSHVCIPYEKYKNMPYDLWLSWFIGYTDGDGSIVKRKDRENLVNVRYVAHVSNLPFHQQLLADIKLRIDDCNSSIYFENESVIRWRLAKKSIVKTLKEHSYKVPSLDRKWSRVNFA